MASTPTFDASGIANPATSRAAFAAARADPGQPLLDRAIQGRYVPGSVFKIVTAIAGLSSGAITPATTFAQQPAAERTGLLVDGFLVHDGHHLFTGNELLDFSRATEVSCNIWFALAGLRTGGAAMDAAARRLGFGAPIPFDLPTAASQLTNGGGPLPGGFVDDVELANASYGQGEVLVTPLQMALVAATVANGGIELLPRLVTAYISPSGAVRDVPGGKPRAGPVDAGCGRDHGRHDERCRGSGWAAVHHRSPGPRGDRGGQDRDRAARRQRRAKLVVHRLRAGRGTDHRARGDRGAGRWGSGQGRPAGRQPAAGILRGSAMSSLGPPRADASDPAQTAEVPATDRAERRPLIERIGLALVGIVVIAVFGALGAASFVAGEPFLALMAALGALMTAWAGARTLFRG